MLEEVTECFILVMLTFQVSLNTKTDTAAGNHTRSATCDPATIQDRTVVVECWSDLISPQGDCRFQISTDSNNNSNASNVSLKEMNYSQHLSAVQSSSEIFYKLTCFLRVGIQNLGRGIHAFQMVVSSNTSDANESIVTSNTVSVNVESTSSLLKAGSDGPHCYYPEFNETHVNFQCFTELVLEPLECQYNIKPNGNFVNVSGVVTYAEYLGVYEGKESYVSECNLAIPARRLGFGAYFIQLVLNSRDGHGNAVQFLSGYQRTPTLSPPRVKLDSDCLHDIESTYLRPGETRECRCYLKSRGYPYGTLRWVWTSEDGRVHAGPLGELLMSFDFYSVAKYHTFSCQPISPIADNLSGVDIWPKIFDTTEEIIFTANNETDTLEVNLDDEVALRCLSITSNINIYELGLLQVQEKTVGSYTYVKRMTTCGDSRTYVCRARSQNLAVLEKRIDLLVKCPIQNIGPVEVLYVSSQAKVNLYVTGYPTPTRHDLVCQSEPGLWRTAPGYTFRYTPIEKTMGEIMLIVPGIFNKTTYEAYKLYVSNDDRGTFDYIAAFNFSQDEMISGNRSYNGDSNNILVPVLAVLVPALLVCMLLFFIAFVCGRETRKDEQPTDVILESLGVI